MRLEENGMGFGIKTQLMSTSPKQLLKRIADLVNLNKALKVENEQVYVQNDKLTQEVEQYKNILSKLNSKADINLADKHHGTIKKFKMATVMFAEAQGFADISEEMDSKILVDHLDDIYRQFDEVISRYEISKVKSIGDTLLCVGGVPTKNTINPVETLRAAIEVQYYVKDFQKSYDNIKIWKFRIGIHTGPVTVVEEGKKRKAYELKGDSVNIATRVRAFARPGEIMITENTYELVKEFFQCSYVGKMPVKYIGNIRIFKVLGIKSELSIRKRGILPNKQFIIMFRQMLFTDLQEVMLDKLERELPQNLYYHNVKHTVDVVTQVELIGWGEGISEEEILLLKTAALFHDAGHIFDYNNHEERSAELAREILPKYYFNQEQIDQICKLIMATKLPPAPENLLEEIMCDSDLDYLGRSDMIPVSGELFKELRERDKIGSLNDWNKLQIKFISNHQYFTKTAKSLREVNKKMQIDRIKKLIVN